MAGKPVGYLQSVALKLDLNVGPLDSAGAPNHYATPSLNYVVFWAEGSFQLLFLFSKYLAL